MQQYWRQIFKLIWALENVSLYNNNLSYIGVEHQEHLPHPAGCDASRLMNWSAWSALKRVCTFRVSGKAHQWGPQVDSALVKGSAETELPQVPLFHLWTCVSICHVCTGRLHMNKWDFDSLHLIMRNDNNLQVGPFFLYPTSASSIGSRLLSTRTRRTRAPTLSPVSFHCIIHHGLW